jgi:DUF971 family protein
VPPRQAGRTLTAQLTGEHVRLYAGTELVAEHRRSHGRGRTLIHPEHQAELEAQRRCGARERLQQRFLALSPVAADYHRALAERRLNAGHHLHRIVALVDTHGEPAVGRAIENAHDLGAYSSDYIVNLLEQRTRLLPEPGPLHLTHAAQALALELPAPDLSPYTQQ